MKPETKICQNCKNEFTIESDDFSFYEKIKVPAPTFCPLCRAERRFVYRNERKLFKAKDFFTQEDIFSLYPQQSNRKIITHEEWHSDIWSAEDYGFDYDFSKNFFEQFSKLEKEVPVLASRVQKMVNSPYSSNATGLKNCYLCFASSLSENCMYGINNDFSDDCIDNSHINHSQRCYNCFWLQSCYQCYFTIMSVESNNLWFCRDCLGCNDCFGCTNLRKSSYFIFNKQYTKEEYQKQLERMKLNTISGIKEAREKTRSFWLTQPVKCHQGLKNINSYGSYVTNSKNVRESYIIREGEDIKYCQYLYTPVPPNRECFDANNWGCGMELHYETCMCGDHTYNIKFSTSCWPNCKNLEYCMNLFSCSDCFACAGLKKKQYCIFNKQYTKDEYFELVEKIKKQMNEIPYIDKKGNIYKYGEFFPIELSPFGYNNTLAIQHFNMGKEEALNFGYPWIEVEKGKYTITKKIKDLPELITNVEVNIIKEIIECDKCKSPYKIISEELAFYKKENLPIPHLCPECRYEIRTSDRFKIFLYERKCMCNGKKDETGIYANNTNHFHGENSCTEKFKTGYSSDRPEIVYCEKCYQQEVY
jgi:hypothetical protein